MKRVKCLLLFAALFNFLSSKGQGTAINNQTQGDFVSSMMSFVEKVVAPADIQITSNTLTETDLTKRLTGNCNFFGFANLHYTGLFDLDGKIKKFFVEVPFLQKVNPAKVSRMLKSGDWANLFLPDEIKDGIFLSRYSISFNNSLGIDSAGAVFSFQPEIPVFGLKTLRISNISIGYSVASPLSAPSVSGVLRGSLLWGDPSRGTVPSLTFETNLVLDPKKWQISMALENMSLNSIFENFGVTKPLIPNNVNSLLTLTKGKITIKPFSYSFLFEAQTPLITANFLIKRVESDGGQPIAEDTIKTNTSLTGAYTAKPPPPPDDPDPPPTPPAEVKPVPVPQKTNSWGIMIGFSLPESNTEVNAIQWMEKIGLTNIGVVFSTFKDATATNLPIFANLGSGNTLLEKGFSFVSWISINDLFNKFKLVKPLKAFSSFMQKASPFDNIMFRAHVPLDIAGEFSMEGDINFNQNMKLVPLTDILDLSQLRLELAVTPTSGSASFSFGVSWTMNIDPSRTTPLVFDANMSVVPSATGSITLAVSGQMSSAWTNPYYMIGLGINSPKFSCGLSFSEALVPIPDDLFFSGQMIYGALAGDITLGVNYNELMKNMLMARICNLSLTNIVDQFTGGLVKTNKLLDGVKNKYLAMLNDVLNMELSDAYFKAILSDNSDLMAGLRLEADYMKNKCNTTTAPDQNWLMGVHMAAAGKFAGFKGRFDVGVEGSLSSLSGGITVKAMMDRINFTYNGFTIFRLSGSGPNDPFQLFLDLSSNNLLNVAKGLLSDPNGSRTPLATITSNVPVYIKAKSSGKQIDIEGASKNMQAKVQQWTVNNSTDQQFMFDPNGDGYYSIRNVNSGMDLDVQNGLPNNGQPVWQYIVNNSPAQLFKLVPLDNGAFEIESKLNPNLVFDISGASTADGAQLAIRTRAGTPNQQFQILPVEPGPDPLTASSDRIFYLSGGLNILEAGQSNALIELTPTGYKASVKGKIYKFLDGSIDASIGSFADILNTTTVYGQVNVGAIQEKIMNALSASFNNIPFFNELKKGFFLKSISFSGKLSGMQSSVSAKVRFKVAGQTFSPDITISMGSSIDFFVNTVVAKIREIAKTALDYAKQVFDQAIAFAANAATEVRNAAVAAYNTAKQTATAGIANANALKSKLAGLTKQAYDNMKNGILAAAAKMQKFLIDFGGFSNEFASKIYKKSVDALEDAWSGFKSIFPHGDNEELKLIDGPSYRIISKIPNLILKSHPSKDKNYSVEASARQNIPTEYWQIDPSDVNGQIYLVSGYNGMSITMARWEKKEPTTYCIIIPHESDHKSRERMIMEPVPNEPGWYFLRYASGNVYVSVKRTIVNDPDGTKTIMALYATGANARTDAEKFRFEMVGAIDWKYLKNTPAPFPPYERFIDGLKEGNRYLFDQEPEQYLYTNGAFHWIPDITTLNGRGWDKLNLITLPFGSQVGFAFGDPIPSIADGLFYQVTGDPAIYVMDGGKRHWVPDPPTFSMINTGGAGVLPINQTDMSAIPLGDPIPSQFVTKFILQEKLVYTYPGNATPYLFLTGQLRRIPDNATFTYMGFSIDILNTITADQLNTSPQGPALPSLADGQMLQATGDPTVYYMQQGIRRAIPDAETLNAMGLDWNKIQKITLLDLQNIKMGPAMLSLK